MQIATEAVTDLSSKALARANVENLFAWLETFSALPNARFEPVPGLTRFATSIRSPMFNGVMRTALTEEEVDTAIESTEAFFRLAGRPMAFWWIGPDTQPADLGERLLAHGWQPFDVDAAGMAIDLRTLPGEQPLPEGLRIKPVGNLAAMEQWARAFTEGYGVPDWAGQSWVEATTAIGFDRAPWRHYLGYLDDQPVAASMAIPAAGVVGIVAVMTVPAARRRGIGKAMTLRPLHDARVAGYHVGTLFSTPMAESLYRSIGFRDVCRISRYLWLDSAEPFNRGHGDNSPGALGS